MTPSIEVLVVLFDSKVAADPTYVFNRDCDNRADFREEVERMWTLYKPFCPDPHFETEFRNNFLARLWEIHLGCALIEHGFKLVKPPARGPDLLVEKPRLWVEAVTATSGSGNNEVRELPPGQAGHFPENEIILRLTSALVSKQRKIKSYVEKSIIKQNEPVIIAINSSEMEMSYVEFDPDVPMIVKTVFPLGDLVTHIPIMDNPGKSYNRYKIEANRTNTNGAKVPTDNFLSPEYSCISAVLFCPSSVLNSRRPYGRNFRLVHNPLAAIPLALGTLPMGFEYWTEKDGDGVFMLQKPKDWRPTEENK